MPSFFFFWWLSAAPIPTNDKRLPLNGTSTRSRLPLPFALSSVSCGMATANQQQAGSNSKGIPTFCSSCTLAVFYYASSWHTAFLTGVSWKKVKPFFRSECTQKESSLASTKKKQKKNKNEQHQVLCHRENSAYGAGRPGGTTRAIVEVLLASTTLRIFFRRGLRCGLEYRRSC